LFYLHAPPLKKPGSAPVYLILLRPITSRNHDILFVFCHLYIVLKINGAQEVHIYQIRNEVRDLPNLHPL